MYNDDIKENVNSQVTVPCKNAWISWPFFQEAQLLGFVAQFFHTFPKGPGAASWDHSTVMLSGTIL